MDPRRELHPIYPYQMEKCRYGYLARLSIFDNAFPRFKKSLPPFIDAGRVMEGTGNRESFKKSFFSKDSIIWWTIKTHGSVRKKYEKCLTDPQLSHIKFIRLRNDSEVESFLANLNFNWQPLSPTELRETLINLKCQWAVAGGWAIDLFLGKQTRNHEDIDIIVKREDQFEVQRALKDWELWVADPPGTLRPWRKSEFIGKGLQDIWCRRSRNDPWQIQVMLYDVENGDWIFKRDKSIRRPLNDVLIDTEEGYSLLVTRPVMRLLLYLLLVSSLPLLAGPANRRLDLEK